MNEFVYGIFATLGTEFIIMLVFIALAIKGSNRL